MARILFVPRPGRGDAAALTRALIQNVVVGGHVGSVLAADAQPTGLDDWAIPSLVGHEFDFAVSIGGDGTMLRALDLVCRSSVPVLGVNVGHLGYLTEVDPDDAWRAVTRVLDGNHRVEERMMLQVRVIGGTSGTELSSRVAVNEVVVEKTTSGNTVRLGVEIDGHPFLTYAVDGIIVATPTGSTAYNLSARGPILSPQLEALLMTPVSPHMLFDRSLVLSHREQVKLRVLGTRDASVVVDGRHIATISPDELVECKAAEHPARIVTFGDRDVRRVLKVKFGLADR